MFITHRKAQGLADKALNRALVEMRSIQGALDKRVNALVAENKALSDKCAGLERMIVSNGEGVEKLAHALGYSWRSEAVKVVEQNPLAQISKSLGLSVPDGKEKAKLVFNWVKRELVAPTGAPTTGSKGRAKKAK